MRLLLIHSDKLDFKANKKALKDAEVPKETEGHFKDCLVVFWTAEDTDTNADNIAENAFNEIKSVAGQINEKNIILYPYVHLLFGAKPAGKDLALEIEGKLEEKLKAEFEVHKAPFGYYKSFGIECKGHPLSELSRVIGGEKKEIVSEALKKEETLKSKFYVFEPGGNETEIRIEDGKLIGFNFSKFPKFEKLVKYELAKNRAVDVEPPHIKLMKKLELADYEPASDPGNMRYYPKGRMIKALLEEWVTKNMLEYGAMEVETPLMYDLNHPTLKKYLNRFPARQYQIDTPNKKVFLRFAACFGQFLMAHDANISYRNLPLRLYELTRYSFRVEQRGELAGLRRLRAFTMPDCHAMCADMEESKVEMMKRFDLAKKVQEGIGLTIENDFEFALRLVRKFYDENKEFVHKLIDKMGKPVLVEIWEDQFFYFVLKHEWNFVDALDKAATLTTDQFDVENSKTYDINYVKSDGTEEKPVILHLSPSGAIERVLYAVLEKCAMEQAKGKNPILPLWLSPTQVRICPVSDEFVGPAVEFSEKLEKNGIRSDVDDRMESIPKKVRSAEIDWVPLIIVFGEKEKSGELVVRFRETGKTEKMSFDGLVKYMNENTNGMPFRPLPVPKLLTRQVKFVG
ncbi:MAG: threonine--tRNA ligase [Candidatus Aenigmarchaeota archaeon]|nr:threonine--tRNA ligase [Candidatus Aenigmarchaeota archaeon]